MDKIDSLVIQLKSSDQTKSLENLINSLKELSRLCQTLINLAPQYDWKDVPFNGYRSIVKLSNLFVTNVIEPSLKSGKINDESIIGVINLLIEMSKRAITFSKETQTPSEKIVGTIVENFFVATKKHFLDIESHLVHYWGHHAFFWLKPSWPHYFFSLATALTDNLPYSLLASVSNEQYGALLTSITWKALPYLAINVANYSNNFVTDTINSLLCTVLGIVYKKFLVPRQSRWIVSDDGHGITKPLYVSVDSNGNLNNIKNEQSPVLCYLMKSKSSMPSGDVIIHAQGGGFMVDARQSQETYLRDWVQKLDGATIINVIYSRFVRYPCALQELIDVYFWLISDNEDVIKILGFKPRRIICLGDSVGVLLLLTMCSAIRDIQLICPSEVSLYPEALMGISPAPSIATQNTFPSLLLSYVEITTNLSLILQCSSLYSTGVHFDSQCFDLDSYNEYIDPETSSPPWLNPPTSASFHEYPRSSWIKRNKSWHDCDPDKFRIRANKIASRMVLPYISPLISYDFNAISDLKLVLIASEFDLFLDMTIELAKKWKGKISFDVIENLPHAFYTLYKLDNQCYKATEFCFQKLKDLCS